MSYLGNKNRKMRMGERIYARSFKADNFENFIRNFELRISPFENLGHYLDAEDYC